MAVDFNHTIVWAKDSKASAAFLAEILGLPAPKRWGPFLVVATNNGVNVDFMDAEGEIARSIMPSSSARESSTKSLAEFANGRFPTGPILRKGRLVRSIITTAGAASISRTRTGTFWR